MLVAARKALARAAERVHSPEDSDELRLHKTLLIFACGLMGFAAMLWLAIYNAMGIRYSSTVPLLYMLVSATTLGIYLWNLNFEFFRFAQTCLYLFVPFIMQWSIGSYVTSSGVMLWALLAPIGVMVFQGAKESVPWFFAYIVMTAVSGFFDYYIAYGADLFSWFDNLADQYGLEKIKTIGDAYMVAGGLQAQGDGHTEAIARMALAVRDGIGERRTRSGRPLGVHIGIGTGPAAAGVIGVHKFIYDMWGNTVNIASRLTTEATSGGILVDVATYRRLRNGYRFEGPEALIVKGQREITAYRLLGPGA